MMTLHLAVEGALGKCGYVPIEAGEVCVTGTSWETASKEAVLRFAELRKFKRTDFKPTDDHKIVAQANAWGYDEPWINGDGYIIFIGANKPNEKPDPVYAYWIPEKERMRQLESRMPYPTKAMMRLVDTCALLIQDEGLASSESVNLIMKAYGHSLDTLNRVLEATCGECDVVQRYADKLKEYGLIKDNDNNEETTEEEIETIEVVEAEEHG